MSGTNQRIYYWDSCIYLARILNEQSHGQPHIGAMEQIANDNFQLKNMIFTSVITLIEVLESKMSPDQRELFRKTFLSSNHVLYDVDPPIAHKAREFRERVKVETQKILTTPDAIHLATASIYGAHEVHTFDDGQKEQKSKYIGMLELSGRTCVGGLMICKPTVPQSMLPLFPNPAEKPQDPNLPPDIATRGRQFLAEEE